MAFETAVGVMRCTCSHALLDALEDTLSISQVMGGVHPLTALLACSFGLS